MDLPKEVGALRLRAEKQEDCPMAFYPFFSISISREDIQF
jgi:hypothetical protein